MKGFTAIAALAAALGALPSSAAAATDCERLVAAARSAAPAAWSKGAEAALQPMLLLDRNDKPPADLAAHLASLAVVKARLGEVSVNQSRRLPGTDIYMVSSFMGTAECQDFMFLKIGAHGSARVIADPPMVNRGLCWTSSADVGGVDGHPVYVEHGRDAQTTFDEHIQITPWTGKGWGAACRFSLTFAKAYRVTQRFCGDQAACRTAGEAAADIASRYDRAGESAHQTGGFWYGAKPGADAWAALAARGRDRGAETTPFPTFGATPKGQLVGYSYEGFALFPLTLGGGSHIAAIGYDGVGWRQSDRMLLSIYAQDQGLTPLAGFVIDTAIDHLVAARLERPIVEKMEAN